MLPGTHYFLNPRGTAINLMVASDGTLDYDRAFGAFITGRGTSNLVLIGTEVTIRVPSATERTTLPSGRRRRCGGGQRVPCSLLSCRGRNVPGAFGHDRVQGRVIGGSVEGGTSADDNVRGRAAVHGSRPDRH